MNFFGSTATIAVISLFAFNTVQAAERQPRAPQIKIVNQIGNACLNESATLSVHAHSSDVTLQWPAMSGFVDWRRPSVKRQCDVIIQVRLPKGYQFLMPKLGVAGIADLATNTAARLDTKATFVGGDQIAASDEFLGPISQHFNFESEQSSNEVWSPCGVRTVLLQINSTLTLQQTDRNTPAEGAISFDRLILYNVDLRGSGSLRKCVGN
jgi:hypothetical protein